MSVTIDLYVIKYMYFVQVNPWFFISLKFEPLDTFLICLVVSTLINLFLSLICNFHLGQHQVGHGQIRERKDRRTHFSYEHNQGKNRRIKFPRRGIIIMFCLASNFLMASYFRVARSKKRNRPNLE